VLMSRSLLLPLASFYHLLEETDAQFLLGFSEIFLLTDVVNDLEEGSVSLMLAPPFLSCALFFRHALAHVVLLPCFFPQSLFSLTWAALR